MNSLEVLPIEEITVRIEKARGVMRQMLDEPIGMLFFSRTALYYFSGHWGTGVFFLPVDGEPLLFCRRGIERARLESPLNHIISFRSYRDIAEVLADFGYISEKIGVEKKSLDWEMAERLQNAFVGKDFVSCDLIWSCIRAVKTDWELRKMELCGKRHDRAVREMLPKQIHCGMTEREIALVVWQVFFELGHQGMMRMQAAGEEIFLGHVSAGDSGNYPSVFDGALGLRGMHPAAVHMGYQGKIWQDGEPLTLDCGFVLEGYHSDKTQVFWGSSPVPDKVRVAQQLCVEIEHELASMLRSGNLPENLYKRALEMAEAGGQSEGFMGLGGNKVKFLGHGIGLNVDEFPVIAKKFRMPLQKNMTIALEPKIGIPGVGMVGVENIFVVTENGGKRLSGFSDDILSI